MKLVKCKFIFPYISFIYLFTIYTFKTNALPYLYKKVYIDSLPSPPSSSPPPPPAEVNETKKEKLKEKDEFYNRCTYTKIPKVSGQLETAQYLRYHNVSLIRFGDSELQLILEEDIPKEKANPELAKRLLECFNCDDKRIALALPNVFTDCLYYSKGVYNKWREVFYYLIDWMLKNVNYKRQYLDTFITSPFTTTYNTSCEIVELVYENMREIWKGKDVVILRGNNGEIYDYDVYDTAKSQKVLYAPPNNSWVKYNEIKNALMKEDPKSLYIISVGHISKLLVYDLVKENRRALDLGHLAKDYNCFKKNDFIQYFYAI